MKKVLSLFLGLFISVSSFADNDNSWNFKQIDSSPKDRFAIYNLTENVDIHFKFVFLHRNNEVLCVSQPFKPNSVYSVPVDVSRKSQVSFYNNSQCKGKPIGPMVDVAIKPGVYIACVGKNANIKCRPAERSDGIYGVPPTH